MAANFFSPDWFGKISKFFKPTSFGDGISNAFNGVKNAFKNVFNWGKEQIESWTGDLPNKTNKEIADSNLDFQREQFEYEKALQEEMFQREDTANQRTVNDMRLAGLNPLNMTGTNGAGNVVGATAPQNNYQMNSTQGFEILNQIFNAALSAKSVASNNSLQQANANLLNAQAQNQNIKNVYEADTLQTILSGYKYDNDLKFLNQQNQLENYLFNASMGWTENMPDWLKQNAARYGYKPFGDRNIQKLNDLNYEVFSRSGKHNFSAFDSVPYVDLSEMSSKLISDDLLNGLLGFFGNIPKFFMGK